jgi:hypothetical protein
MEFDADDFEEIRTKFEIKCRKCGSENIVFNLEEGYSISELTYQPGSFSMGCNDCKQNDFIL